MALATTTALEFWGYVACVICFAAAPWILFYYYGRKGPPL
jgi:hypothetical protein